MTLIGYELRKLFRLPALWAFVVLCLVLNFILISNNDFGIDFFNDTGATAEAIGQSVDEAFVNSLSQMPQTENRDILLNAVKGIKDDFDVFDTGALSEHYQGMIESSPTAVKWMQWKYGKLESAVAELAEADASTSLYAGPMTHDSHQFLFGTLMRAISAESMILGVLAALYLFGYERITRTEQVICTTREGRKLWRVKTISGVIAALLMFLILALISLAVYFSIWDYSGIWSANVSSQFNFIQEVFTVKPFITWGNFTVAEYFAASMGMIAALTVITCLISSIMGILVRNTYAAAILLMLLCAGGFSLSSAFSGAGLYAAYEIASFQPMAIWLTQNVWFTESGLSTVLPWQESAISVLWLVLCSVGTLFALYRFKRKDIV